MLGCTHENYRIARLKSFLRVLTALTKKKKNNLPWFPCLLRSWLTQLTPLPSLLSQAASACGRKMLVCLIIKGSCYSAPLAAFFMPRIELVLLKGHCSGERRSREKEQRAEWSERWNSPEGVQCFPVRYTALTERMVGFSVFSLFFLPFSWSCRLGSAALHRSHYSYCQLSKVGGITTSTGENNTLWFVGALWTRAAKENQEVWVTLDRELVKGGTSMKKGRNRIEKTKEGKRNHKPKKPPATLVTHCVEKKTRGWAKNNETDGCAFPSAGGKAATLKVRARRQIYAVIVRKYSAEASLLIVCQRN